MLDANALVGLLAESDRRRVVAALVLESGGIDDLARRTDLSIRATRTAVDRLVAGGLVDEAGGHYVVLEEAFAAAARSASRPRPNSEFQNEPADRRSILDGAFADSRLVHLPAKRSKRLVVLDHLAQRFEPGVRYTERQVNAALARAHDDTAALRRYLVDEGFLDRAAGEYWRSGGSVEP